MYHLTRSGKVCTKFITMVPLGFREVTKQGAIAGQGRAGLSAPTQLWPCHLLPGPEAAPELGSSLAGPRAQPLPPWAWLGRAGAPRPEGQK